MKQNNFFKIAGLAFLAFALLYGCSQQNIKRPLKVILDTDFGDDGDDLLSLMMLHYMQDRGECEIVAIGQANSNKESPLAIDVVNTYYGRPNIPIGIVKTPIHGIANQYSSFLIDNYPNLYDLNIDNVPDVIDVYRRALVKAEDNSIVFVVIGFKKNMKDLLKSPADDISPLTGAELVAKKVKFVSDMGGWYRKSTGLENEPPFNFGMINGVSKYYIENWPTPMLFTGGTTKEIGLAKKLRKLNTPTGRAIDYKLSHDGGWGKKIEEVQAGFDCVSTLIAVRGPEEFFNVKKGCNELDSLGYNTFNYDKDCGHSHIDCIERKMSFEKITDLIEDMLITEPMNTNYIE